MPHRKTKQEGTHSMVSPSPGTLDSPRVPWCGTTIPIPKGHSFTTAVPENLC